MRTKLLIAEPSEVVQAGLAAILGEYPRFQLLDAEMGGAGDVQERILSGRPNVVLLNPTLVDNPQSLCVSNGPRPAFVALVYQYVEQYRLKRYDALVDLRDSGSTIVATLQEVSSAQERGEYDTPVVAQELTPRETAVIVLVAKGLTNKEIADQLHVSPHTVMSHRKNIMHKTGIKSVAGLTVYAMLNHLIEESAHI